MTKQILTVLMIVQVIIFLGGCKKSDEHANHDAGTSGAKPAHQEKNTNKGASHQETENDDHAGHEGHDEENEDGHDDESEHGEHAEHEAHDDHEEENEHAEAEAHNAHEDEHEEESKHNGHDEHEEEGEKDEHAGHDDHGLEIELSSEAMELAGIQIKKVKQGKLSSLVELAGEVGLNEDRVSHVVPRFPGIAKKVFKKLGDRVSAGETLAEVESNESLSSYKVKSLLAGSIIEKHITLGEFVSDESTVFVVADLSDVWVKLAIYDKDIDNVKLGSSIEITSIDGKKSSKGKIAYMGPVYDASTRNLTARVVLTNPGLKWKPGMFVRGKLAVQASNSASIVDKSAIQFIEGKTCVFVPEGKNRFRVVEVTIREGGGKLAEILSGLSLGDAYVASGAFEIKSKLITGSMGAHAGHGH